jgi:hypothetical protein
MNHIPNFPTSNNDKKYELNTELTLAWNVF